MDNKNLQIKINNIHGKEFVGGFSLNVGNPHVVFFVDSVNQFDLKKNRTKNRKSYLFSRKM